MIRKILLILVFFIAFSDTVAQTQRQSLKENEVPDAVKQAFNDALGYPVEEWVRFSVNETPRYVAVFQQLDPSSGKVLQNRYRYNSNGKLTSFSQYHGDGNGVNDFPGIYLGESYSGAFKARINKLLKDNTLISLEAFYFIPGNPAQDKEGIYTHRFVFKDKKGKRFLVYFNREGTEVDITRYPVRQAEAEEMD
ncbi:MAG: hypothetical protein KF725_10175 [Cyclobacteriaceae bacterium]|nr:hypothetical protein [Cyclobacteriaceae bacterium]UYN86079.1 MAG: hypothetical protein KIT51_14570 [Cyclobacteriaceae bacterium]